MPGRVTDETESIPTPTEHGENMKRTRLTWTPPDSPGLLWNPRKCSGNAAFVTPGTLVLSC